MKLTISLLFLIYFSLSSFAGVNKDSLWGIWNSENTADSIKLKAMSRLAKQGYVFSNPDSSIICGDLLFKKANKLNSLKYQADARNTQGIAFAIQGQFNLAIQKYMEALKYYEKCEDERGQASTLNNIGVLYSDMGDLEKSLEHYERSLSIKRTTW